MSNEADVNAAVEAARAAFPGWAAKSDDERSRVMLRIADLVDANLERLAVAESLDQGKPVSLARSVDIPRLAWNFRFFATAILHHREHSTTRDGALNYTLSQPLGVCGLISPWNLPIYLLSFKIAPCIAVGNTCVCKPSEFTSLTASLLCELLGEAGVPAGVVNVVFGTGPSCGSALVAHPDVPAISFTGSTPVGELIAKTAARYAKKVSLELGGKNANIVFADADLDKAVATSVRAAFANQGEICLCGSRLFVHEAIFDEFVERYVSAVRKIKVGDPRAADTVMGALVSRVHYEKVLGYIRLAEAEGGRILCGGVEPPADLADELRGGYYVQPTVVVGLSAEARCCQEEVFGPFVTIIPFASDDEAVAMANSVQYGLSASLWTADLKRAHTVARRLHAGTVWINCWMVRDLRAPFGGTKMSGVGREGGEYSLEFYTEQKNVCVFLGE